MMIVIISDNKSVLDYKVQKWARKGNYSIYPTFYQIPPYIKTKIIYRQSVTNVTNLCILLSVLLSNTLFSPVIGN